MATVEVEEREYRGYRLQAVRIFATWECSIYPTREGLPLPATEQPYRGASAAEAIAMAIKYVDRLLDRR